MTPRATRTAHSGWEPSVLCLYYWDVRVMQLWNLSATTPLTLSDTDRGVMGSEWSYMNSGNRGLRDISSTDDLHEDRRHRSLHHFLRDKRKLKLRQKYTLPRSLRSGNLKRRLGRKRVVYERVGGLRTWGCQGWVDLHAVSRHEHTLTGGCKPGGWGTIIQHRERQGDHKHFIQGNSPSNLSPFVYSESAPEWIIRFLLESCHFQLDFVLVKRCGPSLIRRRRTNALLGFAHFYSPGKLFLFI